MIGTEYFFTFTPEFLYHFRDYKMKLCESMNVMLKRNLSKHCLKLVILSFIILFAD